MSLFWLALAVALILLLGSSLFVTLRALEAFRAFKRLGGLVAGELDRIATASGEVERHLTLAAESGTRLEASLGRLRTSRRQLNVLTSALADTRAAVARVTGVYPRK